MLGSRPTRNHTRNLKPTTPMFDCDDKPNSRQIAGCTRVINFP